MRDSWVQPLESSIGSILDAYQTARKQTQVNISPLSIVQLDELQKHHPLSLKVDSLRSNYEAYSLQQKAPFLSKVESNPLTHEQALAMVRDNDRNLVLAAAGTGKTSVMVAKSLDIIESQYAQAEQVLVVAFGRKAATEVDQRIEKRLKSLKPHSNQPINIKASTFHALGRMILNKSGQPISLSKLAEDERKKNQFIRQQLTSYLKGNQTHLLQFIGLMYPKANPFEFKTKEEYEHFIRDNEYRTLNGDLVRSYQEVLIGNWLYLNGIEHEYEAKYTRKLRIEIGFDYRPDFHISGTNIFIEHFGIDRDGNCRPDIDAKLYNQHIEMKRATHRQYDTRLVETFHYEWCENTLLDSLEKQLAGFDIRANPISDEDIFKKLNELEMIDKFSEIFSQAISATRIENLTMEQATKRLLKAHYPNTEEFIPILNFLRSAYEEHLKDEGEIDFDDMIIRATECVQSGLYHSPYSYILVDEFQDISQARMNLIQALLDQVNDACLFAVGDDWQSIYRFSGGKLGLTTRFQDRIGSHSLTKLQKTFRYNNSIADIAGRFIMENPEQYTKEVSTHEQVTDPQVYIIDSQSGSKHHDVCLGATVIKIVRTIRNNDPSGTIAILGRYNSVLKNAEIELSIEELEENIHFWTFHRSKGLEADYCILAGFKQGRFGFPNDNKDHAAVEALLPTLENFPYPEERRLLYVALTRARKKSYLIADPLMPSQFINELIVGGYPIAFNSTKFEAQHRQVFKCHVCKNGYLIRKDKEDYSFYACNTYPGCRVIAQVCDKDQCGAPMIDDHSTRSCNNPNCNNQIPLCPRCYRPLKERSGTFGKFLGCSGYGLTGNDHCNYTQNV